MPIAGIKCLGVYLLKASYSAKSLNQIYFVHAPSSLACNQMATSTSIDACLCFNRRNGYQREVHVHACANLIMDRKYQTFRLDPTLVQADYYLRVV